MAPEMFEGGPVTELVDVSHVDVAQQTVVHCSDACWIAALALIIALFCHLQVYSFGVLMWECLTGAAVHLGI